MTDALRRVLHFNPSQMDSFVQGLDKRKLYSCSLPFRHKVGSLAYLKIDESDMEKNTILMHIANALEIWSLALKEPLYKKIGP